MMYPKAFLWVEGCILLYSIFWFGQSKTSDLPKKDRFFEVTSNQKCVEKFTLIRGDWRRWLKIGAPCWGLLINFKIIPIGKSSDHNHGNWLVAWRHLHLEKYPRLSNPPRLSGRQKTNPPQIAQKPRVPSHIITILEVIPSPSQICQTNSKICQFTSSYIPWVSLNVSSGFPDWHLHNQSSQCLVPHCLFASRWPGNKFPTKAPGDSAANFPDLIRWSIPYFLESHIFRPLISGHSFDPSPKERPPAELHVALGGAILLVRNLDEPGWNQSHRLLQPMVFWLHSGKLT